jgi:hypothetical protein
VGKKDVTPEEAFDKFAEKLIELRSPRFKHITRKNILDLARMIEKAEIPDVPEFLRLIDAYIAIYHEALDYVLKGAEAIHVRNKGAVSDRE